MDKFMENAEGISINGIYYDITCFMRNFDEYSFQLNRCKNKLEYDLDIDTETLKGDLVCRITSQTIGEVKIHKKRNKENIIIADMKLEKDIYVGEKYESIVYYNKRGWVLGDDED